MRSARAWLRSTHARATTSSLQRWAWLPAPSACADSRTPLAAAATTRGADDASRTLCASVAEEYAYKGDDVIAAKTGATAAHDAVLERADARARERETAVRHTDELAAELDTARAELARNTHSKDRAKDRARA